MMRRWIARSLLAREMRKNANSIATGCRLKIAIAAVMLALVQCATAQDLEPAPGYPQDPGKVLRHDTPQSKGYLCHFENATRSTTCVDGAVASANGTVRAAPLLIGRPDRLRSVGVNLVVDCKAGGEAMLNPDGTPYAGELRVPAEAKAALSQALCALKKTRHDSRLRIH
jgi:hypothetical protein